MMLSEDFNRDVERAASVVKGQKGSGEDFSAMEDALFGFSSAPQGYSKTPLPESVKYNNVQSNGVQIIKPVAEKKAVNSKLPAEILESFEKNPTPEAYSKSPLDIAMGSVTTVNEQVMPKQQTVQQYAPQGGQIDYNYLKYIINECVKENLKGKLNESAGGNMVGMKIASGNKFQFLDSKGNVYEAQMVLKKKAGK